METPKLTLDQQLKKLKEAIRKNKEKAIEKKKSKNPEKKPWWVDK